MRQPLELKTKCLCGSDIEFAGANPKPFQPTIVKVACSGCGSRYLVSLRREYTEGKVRVGVRGLQVLEVSQALKSKLAAERATE